MRILLYVLGALALIGSASAAAAGDAKYVGVKKCVQCHEAHLASWAETTHAKSFDSLKPGMKAEAKTRVELDPAKDYTKDEECLGCHTTGFGKPGGYKVGMPPGGKKRLGSVGCEMCHGAGKKYRAKHREAEILMNESFKSTPRKVLVENGQNFDYERACSSCHLAYEGSPYKDAKPPFTRFTPSVDAKYAFDFEKAVRDIGAGKSMHEHFKLKDFFVGDPVPAIRAEFQKNAKEILK